jgi:hypothetical protein
MASIWDRPAPSRWPRGQRFQLSGAGEAAEESYREAMLAARVTPGRAAFDAARTGWAASLGLDPSDGVYLGALTAGARTVSELATALETCGSTLAEIRAAVERLVDLGLLVAAAPAEAPPPARRW